MKPPKCRLCGKEHWTHEQHRFDEEPVEGKNKGVGAPKEHMDPTSKKDSFDRKAYQREYMRKWRAKRK